MGEEETEWKGGMNAQMVLTKRMEEYSFFWVHQQCILFRPYFFWVGRCFLQGYYFSWHIATHVEYFKYLGSPITNDARSTCEIKPRLAMAIAALKRRRRRWRWRKGRKRRIWWWWRWLFTNNLDLNLRNKLVNRYIWSTALYVAETWTLRKADKKYLESFEMCWRRIDKFSWTDCVKDEVLQKVT
jgi:hypothetical protein